MPDDLRPRPLLAPYVGWPVLKLIVDRVLAVFPTDAAQQSVTAARPAAAGTATPITAVPCSGPAVNVASRIEASEESLGEPIVATVAIAAAVGEAVRPRGRPAIRGFKTLVNLVGL